MDSPERAEVSATVAPLFAGEDELLPSLGSKAAFAQLVAYPLASTISCAYAYASSTAARLTSATSTTTTIIGAIGFAPFTSPIWVAYQLVARRYLMPEFRIMIAHYP